MKISRYIKKKEQTKQSVPKIIILNSAMNKLVQYTRAKKIEIMLLGIVVKKDNDYYIQDFVIPPQTDNTGAFVTTDDDKYSEWLNKMSREERKKLRVHYHTHPNMSTTPSGTDQKTITDKVENIKDFYIRIIGNQDLEFHIDLFDLENQLLYEETDMFCFVDDLVIKYNKKGNVIYYPENKDAVKELDEFITVKPAITHTGTYMNSYYGRTPVTVQHEPNPYTPPKNGTIVGEHEELTSYRALKARLEKVKKLKNKTVLKEFEKELHHSKHKEILAINGIEPEDWERLDGNDYYEYIDEYIDIMEEMLLYYE